MARGEPDLSIEAVLVLPTATGGTETVWIPIGAAWRTEHGNYVAELVREPVEWSYSPERRLHLRIRKDLYR